MTTILILIASHLVAASAGAYGWTKFKGKAAADLQNVATKVGS